MAKHSLYIELLFLFAVRLVSLLLVAVILQKADLILHSRSCPAHAEHLHEAGSPVESVVDALVGVRRAGRLCQREVQHVEVIAGLAEQAEHVQRGAAGRVDGRKVIVRMPKQL